MTLSRTGTIASTLPTGADSYYKWRLRGARQSCVFVCIKTGRLLESFLRSMVA